MNYLSAFGNDWDFERRLLPPRKGQGGPELPPPRPSFFPERLLKK